MFVAGKMERWFMGVKRKAEKEASSENNNENESVKIKKRCHRKYSIEYLSFGFTSVGPEDNSQPVCVLCSKVLSNEALKPCKLHLETKH